MKHTVSKGTTFAGLIPGGLPIAQGQGADSFPAFNPTPAKLEAMHTLGNL